jgi:hypothetical protein
MWRLRPLILSLSKGDLLACIKASNAAAFAGLDGLAVDHASAGRGLTACGFSRCRDEVVIDDPQEAAVAPVVEVALHR